jgi:hypothetical protein
VLRRRIDFQTPWEIAIVQMSAYTGPAQPSELTTGLPLQLRIQERDQAFVAAPILLPETRRPFGEFDRITCRKETLAPGEPFIGASLRRLRLIE